MLFPAAPALLGLLLVPFASATISFYDPEYPPGELKGGNWSTSVSKPCRDAFTAPITTCSPILNALLSGGSTFMNTYYPRPNLTDENLSELCTPQCRSGLEGWVKKQRDTCTSEDHIINDNAGWGGSQALYIMPDFMMRYYWNWCIRDTATQEFCLPTRARYSGVPLAKSCATEQILEKACNDSCLKQSLAFFSNIGQLGFASDTYDWGGNGVRVPRLEALCPETNYTKEIEFPYVPKRLSNEGVCSGAMVTEMYTVEPPLEPDVPEGVTIWDGTEDQGDDIDEDRTELDGTTESSLDSLETSPTAVFTLARTAATGLVDNDFSAATRCASGWRTLILMVGCLFITSWVR